MRPKIYNILEKYERSGFSFLRICRFPELLKIYDDARIESIPMILPAQFDLEGLEYEEIELNGFTTVDDNPYFVSPSKISVKICSGVLSSVSI